MDIIFSYLVRQYCRTLINVLSISILLLLITSAFDVLMRYKSVDLEFGQLLKLIYYKVPYLVSEISPLLSVFSVLAYLIWLIQTNQLINIFNSGFSILILVKLVVLVNLIYGLIILIIIAPLSSFLLSKHQDLEQYLNKEEYSKIYNNIIIKEELKSQQRFICIKKVDLDSNLLESVTILTIKDKFFDNKLECKSAKMGNQKWLLSSCISYSNNIITTISNLDFSTQITPKNISHYLRPIYNVSIWQMPIMIKAAEKLGAQTKILELYYYKQICRVFLTILISLIPFYFLKANKSQIFNHIVDTLVMGFFMFLGINILTNLLIHYINSAIMCNIIPVALCLFTTIIQIRHTCRYPI